jgi:serine/threonine protein phosphatase PrpC
VNSKRHEFAWASASETTVGNVRQINEDARLDLPAAGLWVVADGMGGHSAGDVASRMIVESLGDFRPDARPSAVIDDIEVRLSRVNRVLYDLSLTKGAVSGSTVAALATFDRFAACLWAGDSRIYRLRGLALEQVTRDHSEVQELADSGRQIDADPASNVITRAVGGAMELSLDVEIRELQDGDAYLICSDGLYRELPDSDIAWHLRRPPHDACAAMIEQALRGTCSDNVTAVVVKFRRARNSEH